MQWTPLEDSLWAATARPAPDTPPLAGEASADVAVIGGGYCGLSTALHLAQRGVSAIVLEAREPGHGASGRNNGHCVPEWLWQTPDDIVARYGEREGERMNDFQAAAADLAFSLIREHQIECEAVQSGMLRVAKPGPDLDTIRVRAAQWAGRGKPVRFVEQAQLREYIVTDAFAGAMLFEQGGHINPLGYCRGLADAAMRAGAAVHGNSPVTAIRRDGASWRLTTPAGEAVAATVVMATNAFRPVPRREVERAYTPIRALGVATDPYPLELRRQVLPGDHNFQEFRRRRTITRYFFFDGGGRLATGGPIGRGVNETVEQSDATIGRRIRQTFPQLGEIRFTYRWEGWFDVSPSRTVGIHELAPRLFAVIGFSGRGIPTATATGRELAAMIAADDPQAMALPLTPLPRNLLGALKGAMWHNVMLPINEMLQPNH